MAQADESALQFPLPDHLYGFAAQQSCEKLLKALISAHHQAYPFTHKFGELEKVLGLFGEQLPTLPYSLLLLEPFAVQHRYDLSDPLLESERQGMRETVVTLREHVVARILELERGLNP